jgi:dienelactone hydrolase
LEDLLVRFGKPRPSNAVTMDRYTADRVSEAKHGIEQLLPSDRATLEKARAAFFELLTYSLLDVKPAASEVISEKKETLTNGEALLLGRVDKGDRIRAVWLTPQKADTQATPTLIVHRDGVEWVTASSRKEGGLVRSILDRGGVVMGIDAFQTGGAKASRNRNKRAFTVFNQTDDANRVQDILTALTYLQRRSNAKVVNLVGMEMGGVWSWFARALAGPGVNLAADLAQFRAGTDQEYLDRFFVPGVRKAGDFRAAAVLATQDRLFVHNAGPEVPVEWIEQSAKAGHSVATVRAARATDAELLAWLGLENRR